MSSAQMGAAGAIYVAGAVIGALFFGYLTDRFGRKKLFMITLGLYLVATIATAFSMTVWMFFVFRFFTGMGIGGEYAAINSAIDELIPARVRGWVDLVDQRLVLARHRVRRRAVDRPAEREALPDRLGWRLAFGLGAILGLGILLVRRYVPESPRWLDDPRPGGGGRGGRARHRARGVARARASELDEAERRRSTIRQRESIGFGEIARTMFRATTGADGRSASR